MRTCFLHPFPPLTSITHHSYILLHTSSPTHPSLHTLPYTPSLYTPSPTHPSLHTLPYTPFSTHPPLYTLPYTPSPTHLPYTPSPTHLPYTPSPTHPPLRTLPYTPSPPHHHECIYPYPYHIFTHPLSPLHTISSPFCTISLTPHTLTLHNFISHTLTLTLDFQAVKI